MAPRVCLLVGLVCCAVLGASASRHLTDSSLGKYGIYNQGLSTALPLGDVLPKQGYVIVSPGDSSKCNKEVCNKAGGKLSTASARFCDQSAPVAICVCSGAPHDTNR